MQEGKKNSGRSAQDLNHTAVIAEDSQDAPTPTETKTDPIALLEHL